MATIAPNVRQWYTQVRQNNLAKGGVLPPLQNVQFQQGIANANSGYGQQLAQNAYNRGQSQAGFGQQRTQLLQQFHDMRQQMPYQANAQGILGSGIWHQQLQDAAKNQTQALGALQLQQGGAVGQFDLLRQQLEQQRAQQLANLRAQRVAALQQQSLNLQGLG